MIDVQRLDELEVLACEQISQMAFDYIAGGADDEVTLHDNIAAFRRLRIMPRMLVDVQTRDLATTVLGTPVAMPVLIAPMAFHGLCHPAAELATARAAQAAGTIMVASTASNRSLEEIAAVGAGPRWFQLYVYRDRGLTRALVERAAAAGYKALCLTVDTPLAGHRERDGRNRFTLPSHLQMGNFRDTVADDLPVAERDSALAAYIAAQWDQGLSWRDVDWLCGLSSLPVVVKGLLAPADAVLAVEHGAQGVIVSNHGGRQLDTVPATITQLPQVVAAVAGRCEVFMDGGVRRGTDVLKAVALGAQAVLLGRPILWGLALDGQAGVEYVLELLRRELDLALALAGVPRLQSLTAAALVPAS